MHENSDQVKRRQLRAHIAGLTSAAESVEIAAAARPAGEDRHQMASLAVRLRMNADRLQDELEALTMVRAHAPAAYNSANRD